jgi:hypothetical protein
MHSRCREVKHNPKAQETVKKMKRKTKLQSGSRDQSQAHPAGWRQMSVTTKIAAALNLGLSSLGEKLGENIKVIGTQRERKGDESSDVGKTQKYLKLFCLFFCCSTSSVHFILFHFLLSCVTSA